MNEYHDIKRLTEGSGFAVIHKNGNGMDNRECNLEVVPYHSPEAIKDRDTLQPATAVFLHGGEVGHITMAEMIAYKSGMLN